MPSLSARIRESFPAGTTLVGLDACLLALLAPGFGAGAELPLELSALSASWSEAISPFSSRMRPSIDWSRSSMVGDMPKSYAWSQTGSGTFSGPS
jgi:hypothetical protein